jgi:hypothetical protein
MTALRRSHPPCPTAPWRALAGVLAALILALGAGTVSPDAHAWMHGEQGPAHDACEHHSATSPAADDDEHICAVVLFASGVELPVDATFVNLPFGELNGVRLEPDALYLAQPRYLRQPERGPPTA